MIRLLLALWLIVLLVYCAPKIISTVWINLLHLRAAGLFAIVAAILALGAATLYGGAKTNQPPVIPNAPVKVIRIFYEDASGKLFPFDARLKEVQP